MESVRKGLREGEIEQDTYGRLVCGFCDTNLDKRSDPEDLGAIRTCPDCGREWRALD
ncbi:MAG: HVO_0758 family zinc finger protein [Halobacteriales archaeon]